MLMLRYARTVVPAGRGVGGLQSIRFIASGTKPKILMLDPIQLAKKDLESLKSHATLIVRQAVTRPCIDST